MDYSGLLRKSWDTIWGHKFLIGLGVLAALGGGDGGSNFNSSNNSSGRGGSGDIAEFCRTGFEGAFRNIGVEGASIMAVGLALLCFIALLAIVFWVIGRIGDGGLIHGVEEIENGLQTGFSDSFSAGWKKIWRLLGIGVISDIPGLLMFAVMVILGYVLVTSTSWETVCMAMSTRDPELWSALIPQATSVWVIAFLVCCPLWLLSLVLKAVRAFADRACMTEDRGVLDAYTRGWEVLRANVGQVVLLFLIQVAVAIALWILLIIPTILLAICCFLWPLLLVMSGTVEAYTSTLWTLAWRQWAGPKTGEPVGMPPPAPAAPAV